MNFKCFQKWEVEKYYFKLKSKLKLKNNLKIFLRQKKSKMHKFKMFPRMRNWKFIS